MSITQNQFYLTLPSNSSMNYYPNNTVSNYITQLPKPVKLEGEWEVALVEAHYPCSFLTVSHDAHIIVYARPDIMPPLPSEVMTRMLDFDEKKTNVNPFTSTNIQEIKVELKPGDYTDVQELIDHINTHETMIDYSIDFKMENKRIEIEMGYKVEKIILSETLALQLGFDPTALTMDGNAVNKSIRPPNIRLGLPSQMYVYCDLVEPQIVGDTVAPLLKIVNITSSSYIYGVHKSTLFIDPHYVPVLSRTFETVEIDIRDHTGYQLPFDFGTSCMKLHFRKVSQ